MGTGFPGYRCRIGDDLLVASPAGVSDLTTRSDSPFYLISVPRSGATLLAALLNSHKNIAMFNEPWFFQMLPKYGTFGRRRNMEMLVEDLCAAAKRFGILLTQKFKEAVIDEGYKLDSPQPMDIFALFLRLYTSHMGKTRWGVKQPWGAFDLPSLWIRFRDLKVIHIVRDPRATVAYRMGKELGGQENLLDSLQFARSGSKALSYSSRFPALARTNYFELRYEDFVRNPAGWLRRICDFLSEEYDPGMLNHDRAANPFVPREKDGLPSKTHLGVLSSVHTRDVDTWDHLLSWREKSIIEKACYPEIVRLRYHLTSSGREIGTLLFLITSLRLQLRLAKGFFRRRILEGAFHTCRKAVIFVLSSWK